MHYSVNILSEAKFKFSNMINHSINEQNEESKSELSSVNTSLITEEDTSENLLSPEIIKFQKQNKQLHKDLTIGLMNFKSSSRSYLNSSESIQDFELSQEPVEKYEPTDKIEIRNVLFNNKKLKGFLEQVIKLQSDYDYAKKELIRNEKEIYITESEIFDLKSGLQRVQEELQVVSETRNSNKVCCCVLI
ncbi:hypothetical protein SteCoe_6570 [Stentor coeruleus]|uniref:Uncharacterized protein n=1 Tax=Stentor coeruleus TaxID=5963 RepID=A0A1R2CPQ9_9CILI|nr:hypothetical protein SteCoe_21974 [Stentor coeruleus]OMJ90996.1 hypothetical protein SteCoe_6570 [Stentor coeruleus]